MAGGAGVETQQKCRGHGRAASCRREMVREVGRGEAQEGDAVRNDAGYMRDRN